MSDSYFALITERVDADAGTLERHVRSGPSTVGPWSPTLQHGGPPNALAVVSAQALVAQTTGRDDLVPRRLAADFVGAVPVAELVVRARMVRLARSAALVEVSLSDGDRDCLVARIWFVRDTDTGEIAHRPQQPPGGPPAVEAPPLIPGMDFGYGASLDWALMHGSMVTPGPAAAWVRPRLELGTGDELAGLARVVLVADSASGIASELDWSRWSFVNVDLDVHLTRGPQGDWLLMDAATQLGPHGSAVARSTLSDVHGEIGAGLQTLLLAVNPTD